MTNDGGRLSFTKETTIPRSRDQIKAKLFMLSFFPPSHHTLLKTKQGQAFIMFSSFVWCHSIHLYLIIAKRYFAIVFLWKLHRVLLSMFSQAHLLLVLLFPYLIPQVNNNLLEKRSMTTVLWYDIQFLFRVQVFSTSFLENRMHYKLSIRKFNMAVSFF